MRPMRGVWIPLLVSACLWGDGDLPGEPVQERDVLAFAERIGAFYAMLEKTRLDSLMTYRDSEFRSYFTGEREFDDYYAALATDVRTLMMRNSTPEQIVVREFRFEEDGVAFVDITMLGKHKRGLRFWDVQLERTDGWKRESGIWYISPDKL